MDNGNINIDLSEDKLCSLCKIDKPLSDFHNLKTGKYGKHSNCKECRSISRKTLSYNRPNAGRIKCQKCNIIKEVSSFYTDRSASTGLQCYCKSCHKEKIYESQSKLIGFIGKIYKILENKYKKQDIDLEFTKEDILHLYTIQEGKCALSNEMLTYYSGSKLTDNNYESRFNISIDLIDPTENYTIDNIQLIGNTIYRMKGTLNNTEFIHLTNIISNNQKEEPKKNYSNIVI